MTAHVHLSGRAKALLQRLNATKATLHRDNQTQTYRIGTEEVSYKASEELIFLCAVQTLANRGYGMDYTVSEEGQRILTIPHYVPVIKQGRHISR